MPRKPSCTCGICRTCRARVKARERYQAMSTEERKAYVARRDPEKVKAADRARYARDRTKRRAKNDAYQSQHPEAVKEAKRRWIAANPEKHRAHVAVSNALRDGKLTKGPCEYAELACAGRIEAHHDDYSKPLEVRWLCSRHHGETRRKT